MDKKADPGDLPERPEFFYAPNDLMADPASYGNGYFVLDFSMEVKGLADFFDAWPLLDYLRSVIHVLGMQHRYGVLGFRLEKTDKGNTRIVCYKGFPEEGEEIGDEIFNEFDFPLPPTTLLYLKGTLILESERDHWLWDTKRSTRSKMESPTDTVEHLLEKLEDLRKRHDDVVGDILRLKKKIIDLIGNGPGNQDSVQNRA